MNAAIKPVLIVGAGPTGLMAALELSRLGIPVRVVEKIHQPATTSRAVGVQARTVELFEQRGLSAGLIAKGNAAHGVSVYGAGKRVFRLDFEGIDSSYNYMLMVSQAETEGVLRDALAARGVRPEWGVALIGFSQTRDSGQATDSGPTAILEHRDGRLEKLHCDYLIAAEGAHSMVRETSGLAFAGKSLKESYALGDLSLDGDLEDSELHIFSSVHGFLGMFPLGNQRFRLIAGNPASEPSKNTPPSIEELQLLYDRRSDIPVRFRDLTWSSWFHINSRRVDRLQVGRVFLGGDSAHIHSPAGGQGMNTGVQDMVNLGWKLALVIKGQAKPELLETYSSDRIPVIKDVLAKTEGLTQAIGNENPLFRSVFNHIAPWVVGTDVVQHNSTERMSQLALNYRGGELATTDGHAGSLRAGDRLPDLPVTVLDRAAASGPKPRDSTLFELLDPSTFTLFYGNVNDPARTHADLQMAMAPWRHLMPGYQIGPAETHVERFTDLFGSSSCLSLIRPDGYVGFLGSEDSIPKLVEYCQRWLVPAS